MINLAVWTKQYHSGHGPFAEALPWLGLSTALQVGIWLNPVLIFCNRSFYARNRPYLAGAVRVLHVVAVDIIAEHWENGVFFSIWQRLAGTQV